MRSSGEYGHVGKTDGGNDVIKLAACKKERVEGRCNKRYPDR